MIIDGHLHLVTRDFAATDLIGWMDRDGIERVVLLADLSEGVPSTGEGKLKLARRVLTGPLAWAGRIGYNRSVRGECLAWGGQRKSLILPPDNRAAAEAVGRFPSRLLFCPTVRNINELEQAQSLGPICGVKIHAWWHRVDLGTLGPVLDVCRRKRLPLVCHLGGNGRSGRQVFALASEWRDVNFVLAHAGMPFFRAAADAARDAANVYLDTSGPMVDTRMLDRLTARPGPRKLVFGTDGPIGMASGGAGLTWRPALARHEGAIADATQRAGVLGLNLARLMGLA